MIENFKLLIISNNFAGSRVHSCLCRELANLGYKQEVFTYINEDKAGLKKNQFSSSNVVFHYQFIVTKWDHRLYHKKIKKAAKECERTVNLKNIGVIQATTLFSDGGVAYLLSKKYGIPYTVAVRSADMYPFLLYGFHTWPLCRKILHNAQKIIFISESLKNAFCDNFFITTFLNKIQHKLVVQPNGVDKFWLDNLSNVPHSSSEHSIIYVGVFDRIKNIIKLIESVIYLIEKYPDIKLTLVGGRGSKKKEVAELISKYPNHIQYLGEIYDKEELMNLYRENSVLAMPSIYETFGLTYIEALSQNCAIIYSKGQGVDQMVPDSAGIAVNPKSCKSIAAAIDALFINRSNYTNAEIDFSTYDWSLIAKRYYELFKHLSK